MHPDEIEELDYVVGGVTRLHGVYVMVYALRALVRACELSDDEIPF